MKKPMKKIVLTVVIILAMLLIAAAGLFLYLTGKMHFGGDTGEVDRQVLETETEIRESAAERYERELQQVKILQEEDVQGTYTLLVIGTKSAGPGETADETEREISTLLSGRETENISEATSSVKRAQAQAIILMTINHNMEECYFTTFHTDLYAVIPEEGGHRLGSAYQAGGGEMLKQTLERNYGIRIDNYATISLGDVAREMGMEDFENLNVSEDGVEVIEDLVYGLGEMDAGQVAGYITRLLSYVSHDISQTRMLRIIMQIPKIVAYTSQKAILPYEGMSVREDGYLVPDILETSIRLQSVIYQGCSQAESET